MVNIDIKPILKAFSTENGFVKFQIDSFDNFVETRLQKIIDGIGKIEPEVPAVGELIIQLGKLTVGEPTIREADGTTRQVLPNEARLRDLTYAAPVYVDMTPVVNGVEQESRPVLIGDVPIMVKSSHCPLSRMTREEMEENGEDPDDPGAYFIVNGTERVLILTEEIAPNRAIARKQSVGNYTELIRVNSEHGGFVQRHAIERKNDGSIYISFANVRRLPIVVLLKAMGIETDKDIVGLLEENEEIAKNFVSNIYEVDVTNTKEAYDFIGSHMKIAQKDYQRKRVEQLIDRYLLPHLGQETKNRKDKAKYLGHVITKIIELGTEKMEEDDLDHYANKRVKLSGDLLELMFRSILIGRWGLITRIKYNYQKMAKRGKLPPIQTIVESKVVSNQLVSAMGTGAWTGGRSGVSQRLDRANAIKSVSHTRMVMSPLTTTQEHFEARELHPTNWGRFCPAETPEGPTIGLRKNLALLVEITKGVSDSDKQKVLKLLDLGSGDETVIVDGTPVGESNIKIVDNIREKRKTGAISHEINIAYFGNLKEIRISTDAGRVRRPIVLLDDGKSRLTDDVLSKLDTEELKWSDLPKHNVFEYLDAEEEDNALIALRPEDITDKTTHVEIEPVFILGLSASLLPFAQYNRGDRVNFGAKMIGQAVGVYQSNFLIRGDTKANVLAYPQVPLVDTEITPISGLATHPSGQNIVVAIITHKGYNIQDAIVFNKASIERGMFRSFFYRVYTGQERRYWGGQEDKIGVPEKDVRGYKTEELYANLGEDGITTPETPVAGHDILIGKVSPLRFISSTELMGGIGNMRDTSVILRPRERGVVDRVFSTQNVNGNRLIKVAVRDLRIPEVGDKFASRHGQKSVIGLIADSREMPFTSSGIVPDILFNPHSIPSRQTVGQMLEILAGKTGALSGGKVDATAFRETSESELRGRLGNLGFRSDGKETMFNGQTGEMFEVEVFIGVTYYQKLDHMVANKLQARSRGPVTLLTRQPTEGKLKEGGLRLGEMEKDCLIAHGTVLTLKERFDSDKVVVPICKKCGVTAVFDRKKNSTVCPMCRDTDVVNINMSYAFKLLLDELKSMIIYPKVHVAE